MAKKYIIIIKNLQTCFFLLNMVKVFIAYFLSLPSPPWMVIYEWILIIWQSCILSARLWEAAVSQRAAFSASGAFTQEQHGVFCQGLERVGLRWTSPRVARWCTGVTPLICTTQPRACTAGPNSIYEVWHQDPFGWSEIYCYGYCHVPSSTRHHRLSWVTWRLFGSWQEQLTQVLVKVPSSIAQTSFIMGQIDID